jgi:pimeloyl-ACP methyl ester carboxylesterase
MSQTRSKSLCLIASIFAALLVGGVPVNTFAANAKAQSISQPESLPIKLPSGITLNYRVQGDPKGTPIVLLHGAGDSWHSYDLVYPRLPEKYRVYAITLRGHGWSDHPTEGFALTDFAADIRAFLIQLDLHNVVLVGHSLGSFVAQTTAAQDDGRIAKVVLIGSGPGVFHDPEAVKAILDAFGSLKDPVPYTFARDFQASTINSAVPPAFFETMVGEALKAPADTWHGLAQASTKPDPTLASRIKVPTLVLWGDKDAVFKREDEDLLVSKLAHPKFIAYPETGHALHWEQPERFASDLLNFIENRIRKCQKMRNPAGHH